MKTSLNIRLLFCVMSFLATGSMAQDLPEIPYTETVAYLSDLKPVRDAVAGLIEHGTVRKWPTITIDFMQGYQSGEPHMLNQDRYFDFEVKATTNNFKTLVYYYLSTATNAVGPYYAYNFCDKDARVIYKNCEYRHRWNWGDFPEGTTDGRVWVRKHRLASIYDCVQNPTLAYITSVDLIVSTNQVRWINGTNVLQDVSWMTEDNPDLQWAFTRITPNDMERISQMTHPWYNVTPVWDYHRKHWHWAPHEMDAPRRGIADEDLYNED